MDGGAEGPSWRMTVHALLYIVGLACMNSMLGVFAALSGQVLGAILQNPLTLIAIAGILVALAMSMFGYWEIQLPAALMKIAGRNYSGYFGSLFVGLSLGLVAAPCIGPFVVALLMLVAGSGNPLFGFFIFFTLSLGMGLPLFVLALLSGRITQLPKSGQWMLWVRKLMGWVLIGAAIYFLTPLFSDATATVLLSLTVLAAGIYLWLIDETQAGFRSFAWLKTATGLAGIVLAVVIAWPLAMEGERVKWQPYSEKIFAEARGLGKPIIMDFAADWCMPCRQLERYVFHADAVVKSAEKDFTMIRVDLTGSLDPESEHIVRRFNVRGVPTVIFLKPGGEERKDLRLMQPVSAQDFLGRMDELRKTSIEPGK